jgi:hypothetical protein
MSKMSGGSNFKQAGPSNTARVPRGGIQIGGFEQRGPNNKGPIKSIKGCVGTQQVTNQALFNKVMNSPVTKKEKVQNKIAGVGQSIKGGFASATGKIGNAVKGPPPKTGSMQQGNASVKMSPSQQQRTAAANKTK